MTKRYIITLSKSLQKNVTNSFNFAELFKIQNVIGLSFSLFSSNMHISIEKKIDFA